MFSHLKLDLGVFPIFALNFNSIIVKIGNLELGHLPLFLAPMEDVTYKSFRYMCKKSGADVMYTEFISCEALIRDIQKTRKKMTLLNLTGLLPYNYMVPVLIL